MGQRHSTQELRVESMYQFFVEPSQINTETKKVIITGPDVNHIGRVLRMKIGEEISVSNGVDSREYRCGIAEISDTSVICDLLFIKEDGLELPCEVTIFQGLPKADKMELIIQKNVELGVSRIVPVNMKRCVMKLDDKKVKSRVERWMGISEAAAKQSKRRIIPEVTAPMSFKEAVKYAADMNVKLVPYEMSEGMGRTRSLIEGIKKDDKVAIFIGPEGGFDESEIEMAKEAGFEIITLGKRILRTETAGFTVMSWIMYQMEADD